MTDLAAIANQLRSIADQIDPPPPPVTRHRDAIRAIRARKDRP